MAYLPKENITLKTKLKEKEVLTRLSNFMEPEQMLRSSLFGNKATQPYEGDINGQTFTIKRVINYRNSFLPKIEGLVQKEFDGTTIQLKMRLQLFVVIFISVWCTGVIIGFFTFLIGSFSKSHFEPATLIPLGMLLFLYVLVMLSFKYESNRAKNDLQQLFEAEIIDKS